MLMVTVTVRPTGYCFDLKQTNINANNSLN